MNVTATGSAGAIRTLRFWETTIAKKAVMAVSGVVLAGFVVGHLIGNLQIFLGPERFNGYARTLRALPELLWPTRAVLLVMVLAHIWSAVQLAVVKSEARPQGYVRKRSTDSTYSSRTMYWSGPILAAFIIYHLMQFTFGVGGTAFRDLDAYGNVIHGFRVPLVSAFYILSMALLAMHLRHGLWSMFQTLGVHHSRYMARFKVAAAVIAAFIFLGFVSIPVAVLTGLIPTII